MFKFVAAWPLKWIQVKGANFSNPYKSDGNF